MNDAVAVAALLGFLVGVVTVLFVWWLTVREVPPRQRINLDMKAATDALSITHVTAEVLAQYVVNAALGITGARGSTEADR